MYVFDKWIEVNLEEQQTNQGAFTLKTISVYYA